MQLDNQHPALCLLLNHRSLSTLHQFSQSSKKQSSDATISPNLSSKTLGPCHGIGIDIDSDAE